MASNYEQVGDSWLSMPLLDCMLLREGGWGRIVSKITVKFFSKILYEGSVLIELTMVVCLIDGYD